MKRPLRIAGLCACLVLPAACDSENASQLDEVFVPLAPAASQNLCQTTSRVPATKAGDALLWTLDALNLFPEYASESALLDRFDSSVFDTSSASSLAASFRTVSGNRPFALAGFSEMPDRYSISAVLASSSSGYLQVQLETAPDGRVTVLHFEPFLPPAEAPDCAEAVSPAAEAPAMNAPEANTALPANARSHPRHVHAPANTNPNAPAVNAPEADTPLPANARSNPRWVHAPANTNPNAPAENSNEPNGNVSAPSNPPAGGQ